LDNHKAVFYSLLKTLGKPDPLKLMLLPRSGSSRIYFRFFFENDTLIGSFNPEVKENVAHFSFTNHFADKNLPVPRILAKDKSNQYFILEDAGNETLMDLLLNEGLTEKVKGYYYQVMNDLIKFQTEAIKGLNLDVAFPASRFDSRSIMWDLNYFKYYFIKTNNIIVDEKLLENDFEAFSQKLLKADSSFFMYRDFQARNIMVKDGDLTYIDFQGGRQGPLQYDVISLLYQAKANLPDDFREALLTSYLNKLENVLPGQKETFNVEYPLFIYFRLLQVLGAYGFRGLYQRKAHFLQSIPLAIENLKKVMRQHPLKGLKELNNVFNQITNLKDFNFTSLTKNKLNITLSSFSYKKLGIPVDITENGGGFVFDCRALPNPGRIAELRDYTGLQEPVINYLKNQKEMDKFLENVFSLVDQSVDNYLERQFDHLMISFGCTGGKHRSTYSAENLNRHLLQKYGDKLNIRLKHIQLAKENLL
jgi:aminoglycoside/choline kinase family phosphotransferase